MYQINNQSHVVDYKYVISQPNSDGVCLQEQRVRADTAGVGPAFPPFDNPQAPFYCANRTAVNIVKSTRHYEDWLGSHTHLVKPDLRLKHQHMAEGAFPFLRATFYRWMQLWPEVCADLAKAPRVLGVGDLHVENFGTWRDIEGRLVWGVNDFDEAAELPFTNDLVRLAASALLAIEAGHLVVEGERRLLRDPRRLSESLAERGRPLCWRKNTSGCARSLSVNCAIRCIFWQKMESLPRVTGEIPASAQDALEHLLPERGLDYRVARRIAGLGSLGRMRLVAIAECNGGKIAREAKALVPSSVHWAQGARTSRADVPGHHQPSRAFSRSLCAAARPLDRSPPVTPLLPHRVERPAQRSRRTSAALCHGMGNRQYSPGQPFRASRFVSTSIV